MPRVQGIPAKTPEGPGSFVAAEQSLGKRGSTDNEPGIVLIDGAGKCPSFHFHMQSLSESFDPSIYVSCLPVWGFSAVLVPWVLYTISGRARRKEGVGHMFLLGSPLQGSALTAKRVSLSPLWSPVGRVLGLYH